MRGGFGCHEPTLSRHEYSYDIEVGFVAPEFRTVHRFLPRIYVATGEDDLDVYVRLVQCLFLRRPALESGRGDFLVNGIRVNLSGVGYSRARIEFDECPILLNTTGRLVETSAMELEITIHQTTPTGLMEQLIFDNLVYQGVRSHSEPAVIELGTRTTGLDFRILNPDNGGSEPWLLVMLKTRAYTQGNDALAEINFSDPEYDGLELGCVTLYGEYEG